MKKIKRNLLCIIFFLIILFINNKVKATNITISPTNPKVGDTVTVTVSVPNVNTVDVTANVSGVVSGNIKVVGGDLSGAAKSYSNSAQYKCDKEGTISVSVTSNSTAVLNGNYVGVSANKSVNVSKTSSNTSNSTEQKNNQSNQEKSNNANLSNLGIRPNDFSGFSPTKTSYSVTVPNEVESVEVYAGKGQNGQKISGTGSKTLKEGLNTFNITVTAEDGKTTKTYTINITRSTADKDEKEDEEDAKEEKQEETENADKVFGLKELTIGGLELQPQFKSDIYEYRIELNEDLEKLDLSALATEEDASVEITGNENLQEGENIITIIVKSKDEEQTTAYQIVVNKVLNSEENTSNQDQQEKIIIMAAVGGVILIIIIIVIVVAVKKRRKASDSSIPYFNLLDNPDLEELDNAYQKNDVEDEAYNEKTKKKKHSKGKRFK